MVTVIHGGGSLREAVNYNEKKLKRGVASFLDAAYYLKDPADLSFKQKLARLENLVKLNDRVKINHFHASLNFVPGKVISKQDMRQIAAFYMEKIGFASQPYLLYEHHDAGHPHLHVVSTTIRPDGSAINLHNIGRVRSEKARKEIEIQFGLIKADGRKQQAYQLQPVGLQKVQYGKSQTKQAISNVLSGVLQSYHYSSLAELNAVLKQYNILADRAGEHSRIFKNNGLMYTALDSTGQRIGVPIKASDFHFKPTQKYLQQQFERSTPHLLKHRSSLKNIVDLTLFRQRPKTLDGLGQLLEKQGVKLVLRRSESGLVYGLTYVDNTTKSVFNGSILGKAYSAKGIQQRFGIQSPAAAKKIDAPQINSGIYDNAPGQPASNPIGFLQGTWPSNHNSTQSDKLLDDLLAPLSDQNTIPFELRRTSRRKRRRGISR